MQRIAILVFIILFFYCDAPADVIHLKNGRTISADRVHQNGDKLEYEIGDDSYAIPMSTVEKIESGFAPSSGGVTSATASGEQQGTYSQNPSRTAASQQKPTIQTLKVKPGLWETTVTFNFFDGPHTTSTKTVRSCTTERDSHDTPNLGMGVDCRSKIETSTGTQEKGSFSCTENNERVNGTFDIIMVDQEHTKGTSHGTMIGNGFNVTFGSEFTSKWVGQNCGSER